MRTPTALDTMARWLALKLAGVGLFAMFAGSSPVPAALASPPWWAALHPAQWFALVMIAAAYVFFVVHLVRLAVGRARDALFRGLAAGSLLAAIGVVVAAVVGSTTLVLVGLALVVGLNAALFLRVDALPRRPAACPVAGPPPAAAV